MWRDEARLLDMLQAAQRVLDRTHNLTWEEFADDADIQDTILRRITIIGEAARSVSEPVRQMYPNIPWTSIIGMRNVIVHQYADVDLDIIWEVVQNNIPALILLLETIVPPEDRV